MYKRQEDRLGWSDGKTVGVNYGNGLTQSFLTMEQQNLSVTGILAHECGHEVLSDHGLRMHYTRGDVYKRQSRSLDERYMNVPDEELPFD